MEEFQEKYTCKIRSIEDWYNFSIPIFNTAKTAELISNYVLYVTLENIFQTKCNNAAFSSGRV